jgi:hypothetical protein
MTEAMDSISEREARLAELRNHVASSKESKEAATEAAMREEKFAKHNAGSSG